MKKTVAPFRSLPDPETLRRLLVDAGVRSSKAARAPPTATDRISFAGEAVAPSVPAAKPASSDFSDVLSRGEADAVQLELEDLPTLAEMSEADLRRSVFGGRGESMPIEERLTAFVQWLMGGTGAFAAFVADTDGLPLTNHNAPESYLAAVGPLGRAQETIARFVPSPEAGSSTVELDHQNVLQVIWSETTAGRLAVGLVLSGALNQDMVRRIRKITQMSVKPRGDA